MRKIVVGFVTLLLILSFNFAATAGTRPSLPPVVIQELGSGLATYGKTVYPLFERFSRYPSREQRCVDKCNEIEGQPIEGAFGAPFNFRSIIATTVNFPNGIGTEYQENTAMFITWTVRIVGEAQFMPLWIRGGGGVCQRSDVGPFGAAADVWPSSGHHRHVADGHLCWPRFRQRCLLLEIVPRRYRGRVAGRLPRSPCRSQASPVDRTHGDNHCREGTC